MQEPELDKRLQAAWQSTTSSIPVDVKEAQERQDRQRRGMWGDVFGVCLLLGMGLWFWWMNRGPLFVIAGAVMLLSAATSGVMTLRARRPLLRWEDWTPQGILDYRLQETQTDLKLARVSVLGALLLTLFTLYLWWGSHFTPHIVTRGFALLYTGVALPAVLASLYWARGKRRAARQRRAEILVALESFSEPS